MPKAVRPKVETTSACNGPGGEYFAWAHYPTVGQGIQVVRLMLGEATKVEQQLSLPAIDDPWAILGMAQNLSDQSRQMRKLDLPSDITVVRTCHRVSHRDKDAGFNKLGRQEIAARILWVPEDAEPIAIRPRSVKVGRDGIGTAIALDAKVGHIPHVTSVLLTTAERADQTYQASNVIQTVPTGRIETTNFSLVHGEIGALCLEAIHRIPC